MKDVYLAARYSRHPEMRTYRRTLARYNIRVTSRWIDMHGGEQEESATVADLNRDPASFMRFATTDVQDVMSADTLIYFEFPEDHGAGKGGRHTEFGLAIGLGIPVIGVGERGNVFHTIATNWFRTWADFEEGLAQMRSEEVYPHGGRH